MPTAEQELIALEERWIEAIQRKDRQALDELIGPEYVYTASDHGRWTRQKWMDLLPMYDIHEYTFVNMKVLLFGDAAVVLPQYRQTASFAGEMRSGEFLLTDVWARRDGQWQVVARSSVMMPSPATEGHGAA